MIYSRAFQVFLDDELNPISSKIVTNESDFIASQPQVVTIRSTNESITDDDLKLNSSYDHNNAFIFKTDEPSTHTITIKCYGNCNNLRFIGSGISGLPEDFEGTYLN